MARILITGAAGFIGSHLVEELERFGTHEVIGIDRADGDLREPVTADYWVESLRPEIVVHLAAKVGRQFGEDDLSATINDNALMTAYVAQACRDYSARLVYASTSEVYGDQGNQLCVEGEDDRNGRVHNLYGLSKRWGEEVAELYAPEGLTILRLSMPYGEGLPWGRGRAALINFVWQAMHDEPITVHRGAERSWCYVRDTVRGIRLIIEKTDGGTFNVGRDDNRTPMIKVARMVCDHVGAPYDLITSIDAPDNQTVVKRLSNQKLTDLGWSPTVELNEGIRKVHAWIRAKEEVEARAA